MGPDRTHPHRKNAKAGPSTTQGTGKPLPYDKRDGSGIPGVSKLKASIRQTKRFLAKDTLEPALRISTERRLVSLEADLANALKRDVEKKNGSKYHQVKFFERQKLLRIIKRAKKSLADEEEDSKAQKKLAKELKEARIMLNYVRHYPNTQKYISLFPTSSDAEETQPDSETTTLKLPKLFKKSKGEEEQDESSKKRREVLDKISGMMDKGELPMEPEDVVSDKKTVSLETGAPADSKVSGKAGKGEEAESEDDFFDTGADEEAQE